MPLKGKNARVRGQWWHYQIEVDGRNYNGNTGLEGCEQNRTAAEQYAERKRQAILHPELVACASPIETDADRKRKPFLKAAEEFLSWARNVEYRGKPNTAERLKTSMASCIAYFADIPVSQIAALHVEGYKQYRLEEHGVRDITLRHDLHCLSKFFQWAKKKLLCQANVIEEVKIPSDRDAVREHVITAEEEAAYLAKALDLHKVFSGCRKESKRSRALPNMHDLAVLMVEQGARPEELLALRKQDVNLATKTLYVAGGKSRAAKRTLNLTERSIEILRPRLAAEGLFVFPSDRRPGKHVTKLQATHDRICRDAGVSFVIYDWRHTFATRMIAAGVDAPTVAAILGHSSLRTIYRYVHPTAGMQRRAMETYQSAQVREKLRVVG